jgi:hypothetical protein
MEDGGYSNNGDWLEPEGLMGPSRHHRDSSTGRHDGGEPRPDPINPCAPGRSGPLCEITTSGGSEPWEREWSFNPIAIMAIALPLMILGFLATSAFYSAVFKAIRTNSRFRWCDFCSAMGTDVCHTLVLPPSISLFSSLSPIPKLPAYYFFDDSLNNVYLNDNDNE